jgi:hypothetical protein
MHMIRAVRCCGTSALILQPFVQFRFISIGHITVTKSCNVVTFFWILCGESETIMSAGELQTSLVCSTLSVEAPNVSAAACRFLPAHSVAASPDRAGALRFVLWAHIFRFAYDVVRSWSFCLRLEAYALFLSLQKRTRGLSVSVELVLKRPLDSQKF